MTWMVTRVEAGSEPAGFPTNTCPRWGRNFWIRGFAGSGKSVLVVHALTQAKRENDSLRACIVLFTRSLIDLYKTGLPEALSGVPVMTYYQFKKGHCILISSWSTRCRTSPPTCWSCCGNTASD